MRVLFLLIALPILLIGCWSIYRYFSESALPITDPFRFTSHQGSEPANS